MKPPATRRALDTVICTKPTALSTILEVVSITATTRRSISNIEFEAEWETTIVPCTKTAFKA